MSTVDFITGQPVTVTRNYNHISVGTNACIAALDRINGEYRAVLKDDNGILGAIPVNYLQAFKK